MGPPDRSLGERGCASAGWQSQAAKRSSGFPTGKHLTNPADRSRGPVRDRQPSQMAYVTAICNWNKELGFPDPRDVVAFHWGVFRHNFQRLVTSHHPAMKLPIRPAMLEAMALDADLSIDTDLQDLTSYFLLF